MKTYRCKITELPENGVAVIGCNPVGINGNPSKGTGGAMLFALRKGWVEQGEKLDNCLSKSGKVFGLTTVTYPGRKRSKTPAQIREGVASLYGCAAMNPDKDFYVFYTKGKRNLNGYDDLEMAAVFFCFADIPKNIVFEENFSKLANHENTD